MPASHFPQRHVHLDYHTSPLITDAGAEFDAGEFVRTLQDAHVNSVNVFAKCHHGMSYYPTKVGVMHPALKGRDLLGEQIEALHRAGIRAPIYTTVAWEEDVAQKHLDWRQLRRDGRAARVGFPEPSSPPGQSPWHFNNWLHPDYQDYIETHLRELFAAYDVDGLWIDIVFFAPQSCWSEASIRFREKHGLLADDQATQARFESLAQASFARRFSRLVRGLKKDATIFYNSSNPIYADHRCGVRTRHDQQTHWELESLPSGFWGYQHFPRLARAFGHWGKPWLGMTGRFQKMWGDFGGLKPPAALEFECFRSQALGGANSIGDQLPPRGRLDAGAYDLIGGVYAQCKAAEPFYADSRALAQVGIVAPGRPDLDPAHTDIVLEGAVQMCEESHYETVVLDDASSFAGLDLVMLPDTVSITPALARKLAAHRARGGKILFSHRSAFAADGVCELPGIELVNTGPVADAPTYWRACADFSPQLARSDRVHYLPGDNVSPVTPAARRRIKVLVERVPPYFHRSDLAFSSHFQVPPQARPADHAAVLAGDDWVYFADPIFRDYRQSGNTAARDGWRAAMQRLIGPAPFGDGLPTTVLCVPRRRGRDLLITLLHYIPTRKAIEIDMIEERTGFGGLRLRLPAKTKRLRVFGDDEDLLSDKPGTFILPNAEGRLLLESPGYFA